MKKVQTSFPMKMLAVILLFVSAFCFLAAGFVTYAYVDSLDSTDFYDSNVFVDQYWSDVNLTMGQVRECLYQQNAVLEAYAEDQGGVNAKSFDAWFHEIESIEDIQNLFARSLAGRFGNSNFKFVVSNGNDIIFTNMELPEDNSANAAVLKRMLQDKNGDRLEQTTQIQAFSRGYFLDGTYEELEHIDYEAYVNFDTSMPNKDIYSLHHDIYEYVNQHMWVLILVLVSTFIISVLLLIFLFWSAGHSKKDPEKITLYWIDKIYTDVFLVAMTIIFACLIAAPYSILSSVMNSPYVGRTETYVLYFLGGLLLIILAYLVLIETLLSLTRRGKAKTIFHHSLLAKIWKKLWRLIKKCWFGTGHILKIAFSNTNVIVKVILGFGAYLVVNIILLAFAFNGEGFPYLMLFGFNALVFSALCVWGIQFHTVQKSISVFAKGNIFYKINTNQLYLDFKTMGEDLNKIGDGLNAALAEQMKSEHFRTELITNVSHDIKTPLTSIINYVDLLKREQIENDKVKEYLDILDNKSQRLKVLIEDLMEASKVSTGNVTVNYERVCLNELVKQCLGEFAERFQQRDLNVEYANPDQQIFISADGRHMWRIMDNLFSNINKYAMEHTRVYVDLLQVNDRAVLSVKNVSKARLNISAEELLERFVRGDVSRSTEGNGLGLSIAQSLTEIQGGSFTINIDGDLFKVFVSFPSIK